MSRRAGALAAACWLLWTAPAAFAQAGPPDVPAGAATIRGRVVERESGAPVSGADVALYALSAEGVPGMRRTTSDADGGFVFEGVSGDPGTTYLVGAQWAGIPQPGGRVTFAPGATEARVEVPVAQVTADPSALRVGEVRLRVERVGSGVRVLETLGLQNEGARAYHVAPEARSDGRPAFETWLPEDAGAFQMPLGVMPEGLEREGSRVRYWGPVHPGSGEVAWSYTLPGTSESLELATRLPAGTREVTVLVPEAGGTLRTDALAEDPEPLQVEGRPFRVFRGAPPAEGPLSLALTFPAARVDPGAFANVETRVVIHADDAALEVDETWLFRVEGDAPVSAPEGGPLLSIPLPAGATALRSGTNGPGLRLAPDAQSLRILGAASPGESAVEISYRVPVEGDTPTWVRRFATRVPLLSVYVADTGRLAPTSERLHRRRPVRTSDLTYMHLEAFEVEPGESVELHIAALPPRGGLPRGGLLALVGLCAAGAIGLLAAPLYRARTARAEEADPSLAEPATERERQAIYAAIQDLDHDHETGKISEDDHRVLRDELRARAVALLRAERAERTGRAPGSTAAPPAPVAAAPACPGCGAGTREGDRFCAQCGSPLAQRSPREAGA